MATGGSLGLLGNRSVMDTPFNQTNYTAQLIENQQARTIRDVLMNDPSVRVIQAAGGGADSLFIRGFYYDSGDFGLNGLYGIAPYYSIGANFIERVEVFKGPSAVLNGMTTGGTGVSSGGAVGGSINLITKHAPDIDITRLTSTYVSKSQFGGHIDVSRRYGEHKEWGVRLNSTYSNGNTPWNRQTDEFGNVVLGLDYRGENARMEVDVGYQADNLNPPLRFFGLFRRRRRSFRRRRRPGLNFQVPWAYYAPTDFFSTVRGEVDVTDWVTAYAAFGYHDSNINYVYPSPTITNARAGSLNIASGHSSWVACGRVRSPERRRSKRSQARRAFGRTSIPVPINHAVNVNYSINDRTYKQRGSDRSDASCRYDFLESLYGADQYSTSPISTLSLANQLTNVNLEGVGVSDTMSLLE